MTEQLEKMSIVDLIVRERIARDRGQWDEMASCWHPESVVEVSWFEGSGSQFIEQSRKNMRPDSINFHQLSPAAVILNAARAIIDMPCVLQNFSQLDGIDVNQAGHAHLLWRAARLPGDQWLIAGLRAYYVRDSLIACNSARLPALDDAKLARYRLSYRYLSYVLEYLGNPVRDDLPGIDRPDSVETLYASERRWLTA